MEEHKTFTVIGSFDEDGADGFAAVLETDSAADADIDCSGSYVAIVLEGAHELNPKTVFPEPVEWTVPGWYLEHHQRYAAGVMARSAQEAVLAGYEQALADNAWWNDGDGDESPDAADLVVLVGAVVGSHQCADVYAGTEYWALPADNRPSWCEFDYGIERDPDDEE
jgi:hypothetical protein